MVFGVESDLNIKSEKVFKFIFETASDLIAIVDEKFKLEYINEKAHQRITGFTKDDLIGNSALNFIYSKDFKKVEKELKNLYENGYIEGNIRFKHKKGDYIWLKIKGETFFNNGGKTKTILIGKKIFKPQKIASVLRKSEEKFEKEGDDLMEIRFWKLLQTKRALAAFQESQEMLKLIMDNIPQYIAWKDRNLKYLGGNNNFLKLADIEDEKDLIGKTDFDLQWGDEETIYLCENDLRVIESKIPEYHTIDSWYNKKEKEIWFDTNRIPLYDLKGNVVGILITFDDITDRIETEKKLKESEESYRFFLQHFQGIAYQRNMNFVPKFLHGAVEQITGYNVEEFYSANPSWDKIIYPSDLLKIRKIYQKIQNISNYSKEFEYRIIRKDNEVRWVCEFAQNVCDENGKPYRVQGTIYDITQRKRTELKIKQSEEKLKILNKELEQKVAERTKELKQSEKKFRHIFESIPDLFFLVSNDSIIYDYRGEEKEFYVQPEIFLGKKMIDLLPPELGKKTVKMIKRTISTKKPQIIEYSLPIQGKSQFYEARFLFFSKNRVAIFVRNITDRKIAEIKLSESKKILKKQNIELTKLDKTKNDFITMAAHELKTPLISIAGYIDYILTRYSGSDLEIKEDLLIVQKNSERLKLLMNQILDVMKIQSKKIILKKKLTNVNIIINNCIKELSHLIREKKIDLKVNIDHEINLYLDPERIFQVFSNLISNGIKFTPIGGKIDVSVKKEIYQYVFRVKDNGIGLNNDELKRLFKKFEIIKQSNNENYVKSSGLGLYISKRLIEAHGGKVWAISEGKNKGVSIYFTIPI
ncbi:MAG: PAS domain S-box protein [Promethearchaeota archaeon]